MAYLFLEEYSTHKISFFLFTEFASFIVGRLPQYIVSRQTTEQTFMSSGLSVAAESFKQFRELTVHKLPHVRIYKQMKCPGKQLSIVHSVRNKRALLMNGHRSNEEKFSDTKFNSAHAALFNRLGPIPSKKLSHFLKQFFAVMVKISSHLSLFSSEWYIACCLFLVRSEKFCLLHFSHFITSK